MYLDRDDMEHCELLLQPITGDLNYEYYIIDGQFYKKKDVLMVLTLRMKASKDNEKGKENF